jgi:hypothetical protein
VTGSLSSVKPSGEFAHAKRETLCCDDSAQVRRATSRGFTCPGPHIARMREVMWRRYWAKELDCVLGAIAGERSRYSARHKHSAYEAPVLMLALTGGMWFFTSK